MIRLKVKKLNIFTGGPRVAVLNQEDAAILSLHNGDRIRLKKGTRETVAVVDTSPSRAIIPKHNIGVFGEISRELHLKNTDKITVLIEPKPKSLSFIKKKLEGKKLNYEEIRQIMDDVVNNVLTDIELTYFVAGSFINELSMDEATYLSMAMINTGEILKFEEYPIVDKHCIGGVAGNRTTLLVVPIVAACGLKCPKTSSRSITSAAGTADTMEVLANVSFSVKDMRRIVEKTNACLVWGGALNLAPADDKIIKVEHPMSLDPVGQLLASVLAKKRSVSATHVLVDIPLGRGAKTDSKDRALTLKKKFEKLGKRLSMKIKVMITDGSHPIGNGVGPALEAKDVLYTLRNDPRGSLELKQKSIELAAQMLEMTGKARHGEGIIIATEIFESGRAYEKFMEIIRAQGGKEVDPTEISLGRYKINVKSHRGGRLFHIDNRVVNKIARTAGAPFDKAAGVYLHRQVGDEVRSGDLLFTIYSTSKEKIMFAKEVYVKEHGFEIVPTG